MPLLIDSFAMPLKYSLLSPEYFTVILNPVNFPWLYVGDMLSNVTGSS